MNRKRVEFQNSKNIKISGIITLPEDTPKAFAMFAHCFTCTKDLINVRYISEALSKMGIGVLRIDFMGLGDSEGEFADTNFSSNIQDLIDAANYLKRHYQSPKLLIGHSLGGAAAIFAAETIESIKAVSVIGTPSNLEHLTPLFKSKMSEIQLNGSAIVDVAGREIEIGKDFVDELRIYNIKKKLNTLHKPILILHAPDDETVEIQHATEIFMAAHHPKNFISLDKMNHLITNREDADYVGKLIGTWSLRYVLGE